MEIRLLTREEIPLIHDGLVDMAKYHNRVARSFNGDYPVLPIDVTIKKTTEQVNAGEAQVDAVFEDGDIVGFCKITFEHDYGCIECLYIREGYRGLSFGGMLIERALAHLRKVGVKMVDLRVVYGNDAKHFYERYGFHVRSEIMSIKL